MTKETETGQYRSLRTYAEVLILAILLFHGIAFLAYRWIERNDVRAELVSVARSLPETGFGAHTTDIVQYPDGIIVTRRTDGGAAEGFSEDFIAGDEHLVYAVPGTDLVIAKSERDLHQEELRFGIVLAVLFTAITLVLISWWAFVKEKLEELFTV